MSARTQLAAELTPLLPRIRVLGEHRLPDTIAKPTIIIQHKAYTPAPNALGNMFATLTITLATQHQDVGKAEDALDDLLPDLLNALQQLGGVTWSKATKGIIAETYFAWDVEISIPVQVN